jgi:aspartate aminotransferase
LRQDEIFKRAPGRCVEDLAPPRTLPSGHSPQASLTLEISAKAKALQAEGRDICSLSAGEPDFNTPDFIVEAAREALLQGITRYGPAAGDPELRAALADKLSQENGIATRPEQVLICNGGKQAIYNLFQVVLNPGDEVLLPSPYWLSYPEMAALAGASTVLIPSSASDGFRLDLDALEARITPKSRLLVINSPGNPTGRVMQRQDIEALAELVARHPNLLVMSDEIYEYLLADGEQHISFASVSETLKDRCFTVNGFAKGWAMTGWRLGYLAGNATVIKAASALQSQSTSNVCSFAQKGALAAIQGSRDCVKDMARSYNLRRDLLIDGLQAIPGITLIPPKGAFYAFPQLPERVTDSMEFCRRALEDEGLAVVPGVAFGDDRCIRLSCAVSRETITTGLERLQRTLSQF